MPRRPPPRPSPLSPHGIRLTVIKRLLKPEVLKVSKNWGRELAILKRLQRSYEMDAFWLELPMAEKLDSLCWFLTPFGQGCIKEQWQQFQFRHSTEQNQAVADQTRLDSLSSQRMMESTPDDLPAIQPKRDSLAWADSI